MTCHNSDRRSSPEASPDTIEERAWDSTAALANADGDPEFLHELIEVWLRQVPEVLTTMRRAVIEQNAADLQAAAHLLKGSLQILVARQAVARAAALEKMSQQQDLTAATAAVEDLERDCALLEKQVRDYLRT